MAAVAEKIKLVSQGLNKKGVKTGYYKTTMKNKRAHPEKMTKRCFDPKAWNPETQSFGMHVEFKEDKIK